MIIVWLLALPAATPFMQATLPRSADGLLHLYRVVALDHALQQGALFPRWLPDLAYGYGMPLFVFYAPLAYYLTAGLHRLGGDMVIAVNASFGLAFLVAGTGVYLFVKELVGSGGTRISGNGNQPGDIRGDTSRVSLRFPQSWAAPFESKAGILASVAYVYAPSLLVTALERGSLPAGWAAAIFPWAFWAFGRLSRTGRRGSIIGGAIFLALALLAHNISSLIFFPLLLLYGAIELIFPTPTLDSLPASNKRLIWRRVALALGLGVGLAAFFWLPAVGEKSFVHIERVITPPDFDYRAHFVTLADLFSLPPPANTGLLNPGFPPMLGLVQVGLSAAGLLYFIMQRLERRPWNVTALKIGIFAGVGLTGAVFMMLPLSAGVWDRLPLIAFVQHPDRLLGGVAFLLAVGAGLSVAYLPARWSFGLTITGCLLIFVNAIPLLYPRYETSLPAPPTLTGMMAYEQATGAIGATSFGEYVPIWVEQTPGESPLVSKYQAGEPIDRLDPAYLPPGAAVEAADYGFNRLTLEIDSPRAYQVVFHIFYFPGWEARLDGHPLPVAPVTDRGLIGLEAPPGRHRLQLFFTDTPIRRLANGLSALSGVIILWLVIRVARTTPPPLPRSVSGPATTLSRLQFAGLTTLALIFIATKMLYFDRFDTPLKYAFAGGVVKGVQSSQRVNFGQQLNLLGYDLETPRQPAGGSFELTLYWQARQPVATNYSILAHLVDDQGHLYGGQDSLHPGQTPTTRWQPGTFTRDHHSVPIPPGTPPGDYFLVSGPYDPDNWTRLPVIEGGRPAWVDVFPIPVTVVKPERRPSPAALDIAWPLTAVAAAKIGPASPLKLLGATPDKERLVRNDFFRVALFWEAVEAPAGDYQVNLQLLAEDGRLVFDHTDHPSHGRYPTTRWSPGDRVRDNHAIWIPPDFPTGTYELRLRLIDPAGRPAGDWATIGRLTGGSR